MTAEGKQDAAIQLHSVGGDYCVDGLEEAYAAYLEGETGDKAFNGWVVWSIGMIVAAIGVVTLIFGPETITYNRIAGPSLIQYIQIYPGPIATVGSLLVLVGSKLRALGAVSHELFLKENYRFINAEGRDVSEHVELTYLGSNKVNVVVTQ
jgi:hypothetical protein